MSITENCVTMTGLVTELPLYPNLGPAGVIGYVVSGKEIKHFSNMTNVLCPHFPLQTK